MNSKDCVICFYCSEYAKVVKDYPVNPASNDKETFTPRCHLHWKFECDKCGKMKHFNGKAWCSNCKTFTCIECSAFSCLECTEEKMVKKEFLIYDYCYNIHCHKCGTHNPALDFAEYDGTHPFQIGGLQLEETITLWTPKSESVIKPQEYPHGAWGSERFLSWETS